MKPDPSTNEIVDLREHKWGQDQRLLRLFDEFTNPGVKGIILTHERDEGARIKNNQDFSQPVSRESPSRNSSSSRSPIPPSRLLRPDPAL